MMEDHRNDARPAPRPYVGADARAGLWRGLLALAICLGVAVRVWAAMQWPANFQSDEAVFGLMARHILAGDFTPTLYGPAYLGSIESIISAGFMAIFGPSVMAFRMSALLLFGLFFVAHAIFTTRYFGYPVAFVSLLFLALPGFHVLEWVYQPVGAYGAIFLIGTLLLLAAMPELSDVRSRAIRAAGVGLLAGLGLWANNTMLLYLAALGLALFLSSPEWRETYARLSEIADRVVMIPLSEWMPVAVIAVAGLGVLTFFSGACIPEGLYATIASIARTILMILCGGVALYAFWLSRRRRQLVIGYGATAVGFAVGYSPLLYQWLTKRIPPYWAVYPSCLEGGASRLKLLAKEILPGLWGIPSVNDYRLMTGAPLVTWLVVLGLTVAAFGLFLWWNRAIFWRIAAFKPIDAASRPIGIVGLFFAVPLLITILAGNTIDIYSIRHALMATQASAIILGLFVVWLATKQRWIGVLVTAAWLGIVGVSNLAHANANWLVKFTRYEPRDIARLEQFLEENNIKYGFADYWGAYTLDYLIEEKTVIAPFNGLDRYLPYTRAALSAPKLAFIFPTTNAPQPTGVMNDLKLFLVDADNPVGEGAASRIVREKLAGLQVTKTVRVAAWDVWIVSDR